MDTLPCGSHVIESKHKLFQFSVITTSTSIPLLQLMYKPWFEGLKQCEHDRNLRIRGLEGYEKL
jgi:hypothetical protein